VASEFDTAFAAAGVPSLLSQFGQSAIYTPAGSEAVPVSLSGSLSGDHVDDEDDDGGRASVRSCLLAISRDPDGDYGGVADPALNATVTIDGVDWEVRDIPKLDANMATLLLVRIGRSERSRSGYRHRGALDYRR